jgi:hypothetical protein
LRKELTSAADGKNLKTITIFNKAYLKKYEKIGVRRVRPGHEFPDNDYFQWANEWNLKLPQAFKELFGGDLYCIIGTIHSSGTDALIAGSPDYEYGTIIQKKAA